MTHQRYDEFGYVSQDPVSGVHRLGANGPSLTTALAAASATRRKVALLHIDIDMFRSINVNMGEDVGDQTLAAVAQRLRQALPAEAWLWRRGSDEFVAGIGYREGDPDGTAVADALREAFDTPLYLPPYTIPVTLSIGVAVFPDHARNSAELLARAEHALLQVKEEGLDSVALYEKRDTRLPAGDSFARRFTEALEGGELELHYQPTVAATDGGICGFSALLRWNHPERGLLSPNRFMDMVGRVGLGQRLGWHTTAEAVGQLARWRAQGLDYLGMAIHLPEPLLADPGLVDRLGALLHEHNLPSGALELEIPEQVLAQDTRQVFLNLAGLRELGTALTIMDFGMGGLSLPALAEHPMDRLKIDRSFIRNAPSNTRSAAIVRGIIAMGHRLEMKIIAKGVESEAELGFLRRNQCDFFQGFLFGAPQPASQLDELIRHRFPRPEAFATARPERTLLLVDDEENVLRSLARLFRRDGYRVLAASSVREAFDLLASNPVQVIVSDQRMPDMSGTEFLGRVRDLYPDTVRMVLSGYTDLKSITEAINRGAIYRFLTKPWDDDELRGHILAAFRDHEARARQPSAF